MTKQFVQFLIILGCVSCANRQIHPGAIDSFDSTTYDVLMISQSVLDEAKVQLKAGKLPESSRAVINRAGSAYDIARDAWLTYRASAPASRTTQAEKVTTAITNLNSEIAKVKTAVGGVK